MSLKVAEYERQFRVIDEAQKTVVTGPREFREILEKLEITINEMMADGGSFQCTWETLVCTI